MVRPILDLQRVGIAPPAAGLVRAEPAVVVGLVAVALIPSVVLGLVADLVVRDVELKVSRLEGGGRK